MHDQGTTGTERIDSQAESEWVGDQESLLGDDI